MDRRQEHLDSPAFLLDTLALAYCLIGLSDKGFSQLEATQPDWFIRFLYPPFIQRHLTRRSFVFARYWSPGNAPPLCGTDG